MAGTVVGPLYSKGCRWRLVRTRYLRVIHSAGMRCSSQPQHQSRTSPMLCPPRNSTVRPSDREVFCVHKHTKGYRRRHASSKMQLPAQQLLAPSHQRHSRGVLVECSRDDSAHSLPQEHSAAPHSQVSKLVELYKPFAAHQKGQS